MFYSIAGITAISSATNLFGVLIDTVAIRNAPKSLPLTKTYPSNRHTLRRFTNGPATSHLPPFLIDTVIIRNRRKFFALTKIKFSNRYRFERFGVEGSLPCSRPERTLPDRQPASDCFVRNLQKNSSTPPPARQPAMSGSIVVLSNHRERRISLPVSEPGPFERSEPKVLFGRSESRTAQQFLIAHPQIRNAVKSFAIIAGSVSNRSYLRCLSHRTALRGTSPPAGHASGESQNLIDSRIIRNLRISFAVITNRFLIDSKSTPQAAEKQSHSTASRNPSRRKIG